MTFLYQKNFILSIKVSDYLFSHFLVISHNNGIYTPNFAINAFFQAGLVLVCSDAKNVQ